MESRHSPRNPSTTEARTLVTLSRFGPFLSWQALVQGFRALASGVALAPRVLPALTQPGSPGRETCEIESTGAVFLCIDKKTPSTYNWRSYAGSGSPLDISEGTRNVPLAESSDRTLSLAAICRSGPDFAESRCAQP